MIRRATAVSLRVKIAGMVTGIVLAVGLISSLVVRSSLASILNRRLDHHAQTVALAVAAHYAEALAIGDSSHRTIQAMLETDPEVLYAIVYDADGEVLAQAVRPTLPPEVLSDNVVLPAVVGQTRTIDTPTDRIHEAILPLGAAPGYARVGVTDAQMRSAVATASGSLAVVIAITLLAAVALSLGLAQLLTRPILALQRAVRSASLTNLPARAEPQMDDEIGELTRAFNTLATDLARSRDALLAQNRELAALNATAQAISGTLDLDQILQAALDEVLRQMVFDAGWIHLAEFGRAQPFSLAVHSGLSAAFARQEAERDFAGCVCLDVLETGQCRVVRDICRECARIDQATLRAEGLATHVSIPLVARDHVVGVLNVAAKSPRDFRAEEMRLLCSIGRQVGVAVDNARLWESARHKEHLRGQLLERVLTAQEDERRRIALELHDRTGGALASLSVGLRMLEDSAPLPRPTREQVRALKEQVAQIAGDLHQLALQLRPPALDRLGLAEAVEQCVQNIARQHGLVADFQAIGLDAERLPAEVETALYRIVQEALTNVIRHAHATEVGVLLERRADTVVAVIEDNGCGFDVAEALRNSDAHLGLFGMQERAALVSGRWQVESVVGQGTTVFAEVPIR